LGSLGKRLERTAVIYLKKFELRQSVRPGDVEVVQKKACFFLVFFTIFDFENFEKNIF